MAKHIESTSHQSEHKPKKKKKNKPAKGTKSGGDAYG